MPTPNRERIQLFVNALRSGKYAQGRGYLNKNDEYCCLGVACEVAKEHGLPLQKYYIKDGVASYGKDETEADQSSLPFSVIEWYGFADTDPELVVGDDSHTATDLNDGLRYSFPMIADIFGHNFLTNETTNQTQTGETENGSK